MANLPEKNITQVDEITSVPANSKLFVNANGEFRQATVNEVVKSSTVVTSAVENAINTAVEDGVNSHFKQTTGSPILLTDSADGTLIDFKAYGRSTQDGEPTPDSPIEIKSVADGGYFDGELSNGYYNSSTGEYVSQASGRICSKNPIPCKSGDVVKIVLENNVSNMYICYYGENGYISMLYGTENTNFIEKTIPNGATYFTFWAVNSGMTVDTVGHITVTINGKYALIVKSVGKNKLDITKYKTLDNEVVTIDGDTIIIGVKTNVYGVMFSNDNIGLRVGETYVFSVENVVNYNSNGGHGFRFHYADGTYNNMSGLALTTTIEKEVSNVIFYLGAPYTGKLESRIEGLMIRPIGTDDTYEPYKESVTYIPLNEPIRSSLDGTVTDEVSLTEVTRRYAEVVLDGSDDENWGMSYGRPTISIEGIKQSNEPISICSHFKNRSYANVVGEFFNYQPTEYDLFFIVKEDLQSLTNWKAWLQANPITVQYELAEPVIEEIDPVEIVTYDNVTYLTASDDADMELEYPTSKVAGIASIGYSKGRKAEYEVELLKAQLLELQTAMVNSL